MLIQRDISADFTPDEFVKYIEECSFLMYLALKHEEILEETRSLNEDQFFNKFKEYIDVMIDESNNIPGWLRYKVFYATCQMKFGYFYRTNIPKYWGDYIKKSNYNDAFNEVNNSIVSSTPSEQGCTPSGLAVLIDDIFKNNLAQLNGVLDKYSDTIKNNPWLLKHIGAMLVSYLTSESE